jgi:hypothetical protein
MKKMKKNILFTALIALLFSVACTDEDKFKNEVFFKLENGGIVRFTGVFNPLIGAATPDSWSYDRTIWDPNNNLESYDLSILNGSDTIFIKTITEFGGAEGVPLGVTSDDVATALGVDPSTFFYSQEFDFIGQATRNDGVVFTAEPLVADFDNNEFSGNTQENLINEPGYGNAFRFSLTIACPEPPTAANYIGNYQWVSGGVWFDQTAPMSITAGPEENQVTLNLTASPTVSSGRVSGDMEVVLTLNEDQTISWAATGGFFHTSFGDMLYNQAGGANFSFECANNLILMRGFFSVDAGNFGSFSTVWELQ